MFPAERVAFLFAYKKGSPSGSIARALVLWQCRDEWFGHASIERSNRYHLMALVVGRTRLLADADQFLDRASIELSIGDRKTAPGPGVS